MGKYLSLLMKFEGNKNKEKIIQKKSVTKVRNY